ncbi:hypothetical protein L484_022072 [Morus notabilis]|uniref:Acyl-coenzyme A thioesterase 13 n=1 Tax=Morus notabilis TaxID=981085 RepID=W9RPK8_9ROSA|nr:acyl-coenzyme A thioesterase 13 [Morus notabilis]EXC01495.1 hypothetical protein L484_022072 [Morus notabilis]
MDKAKKFLELTEEESETVPSGPFVPGSCFYLDFSFKGIRVDRVEPGLVVCIFKVPPRLTDRDGKLAKGAIANMVDEVGALLIHDESLPMSVSVDMSISYLSTAQVDDELEITSRLLGQKGGYSGTAVLIKNKATGEIIAEGRHSLFLKYNSKL